MGSRQLLHITHCAEVLAPFPLPPTQPFVLHLNASVWMTLLGHREHL